MCIHIPVLFLRSSHSARHTHKQFANFIAVALGSETCSRRAHGAVLISRSTLRVAFVCSPPHNTQSNAARVAATPGGPPGRCRCTNARVRSFMHACMRNMCRYIDRLWECDWESFRVLFFYRIIWFVNCVLMNLVCLSASLSSSYA